MSTTKLTDKISLGRRAAVKTFTRNNNNSIQPRKRPASTNARVTTQLSCVAWFKQPRSLFSISVKLALGVLFASLLFVAPAMATIALENVSVSATNANGSPDIQAGSHPYALTTSFDLPLSPEEVKAESDLRDVRFEPPPGFVGNPTAVPQCKYGEFEARRCPNDTVIGYALTRIGKTESREETFPIYDPVYNMEPSPGVPSEFAYNVLGVAPIFLNASVRTGGDYGITITVRNIPDVLYIDSAEVVVWGVPAEASHNPYRGRCLEETSDRTNEPVSEGECPVDVPVRPFLTNPTSCGVPRTATLSVDSWQEPGNFVSSTTTLPELTGCEKLDFSPTIAVTPDGTQGSTPTGLNVELEVPQESLVYNPVGLAEADVKDTTVTLPAGVQLSPGAADGQGACTLAQIGLDNAEKPACPNASKVATVRIKTPLLEHELEGAVYLASPQNFAGPLENPFGGLVALYLVAEDPVSGVLIKIAGKVALNQETGQVTTTFENTPALPFSDLKLEFFGTDRAPLTTPALCGTYTTETSFTPWSGTPAVSPSSSFQIESGPQVETATGPQRTPCPNPPGDQSLSTLPFSPSLQSGTTNINTGSYSDLTTTFSREDGQQNLSSIQLHYPAGLSGLLSGVKLCGEEQANTGTCGPESRIGETIVSVGLGNDPFTVTGGGVYITGPYEGAPFGLSIVNPAKAGPFDLQEGRPVVVRAKIEVNPITAALTITTDPPGSRAIPTIIDGIPLQIKHVYVNVNRPDFVFNPTNCTPTAVTGTIDSAEGASVPVSDPFQVTNCGSLKFTPTFAVSTSGKTSKASGASLTAKVTEPVDPQSQANIARVKVELPNQLPSRLTTLQKACLAKVFEENPASCPAASFIGHAVVHTKLLPVPLEGPAIFVSHGGEAFPSLEVVLQGDNVTIDLVGATYISKSGITSTTFKTVPDEPFETFEITLPEGPDSALAAIGNLCTSKLTMPTEFVAQNGAALYQNTKIEVTGCPKAKKAKHKKKKAHHKAKKAKGKRGGKRG